MEDVKNEMENIFSNLPQDIIHQIFTRLPLRQVLICRSVARNLHTALSSKTFTTLLSPFPLLALRPPHRHNSPSPSPLHLFDPSNNTWLHFSLSFLPPPPPPPHPIASSNGILYLWANSPLSDCNNKVLIACNPLTRTHKLLPQLGSAWSRHGSVLVDSSSVSNRVIVLNELAALCYSRATDSWLKFSSNLPSKPRSPIIVRDSVLALCDVGSPWRSQWKLFISSTLNDFKTCQQWLTLEKPEWGDVFDILKRPRLLKGFGNVVFMIGGLKSSFSPNASCSTILILKLDLSTFQWGEAGRMPLDMFRCFQDSSKFKVFGGGNRVCFSAKRIGRLALWESNEISGNGKQEWRWIDGVPGNGDGFYRGFLFDARLDSSP